LAHWFLWPLMGDDLLELDRYCGIVNNLFCRLRDADVATNAMQGNTELGWHHKFVGRAHFTRRRKVCNCPSNCEEGWVLEAEESRSVAEQGPAECPANMPRSCLIPRVSDSQHAVRHTAEGIRGWTSTLMALTTHGHA
jgi:hypothetical protein